jgi:hypothetical protein
VADEQAPGALVSLTCSAEGHRVYYEEFPGRAAMAAHYQRTLEQERIARSSGSCRTHKNAEGPYEQGGAPVGRVACFSSGGVRWITWTNHRLRVAGTLLSSGATSARLYGIWSGAGPLVRPVVLPPRNF